MKRLLVAVLATVLLTALAVGQEQNDEQREEQRGLQTASYQLFPVDGSGVSGTLNITSRIEGGSHFVVTLVGISEGQLYLPVLFEGDCGPDRERVTDLPPVGSIANDPYSSISNVSLDFTEVAEGDYFLYIFEYDGEEEGVRLACGEVGEDANR